MAQNTDGTPTVSSPRGYIISGKLVFSGIVVVLAIVFFILFLHFFVRWYVVRRYNRRRLRRRLMFTVAEDPTTVPRGGLDKQVLSSLSVQVFSEDDDAAEAECAVCLCAFDEGEKVRVLPRCSHRFHVDCIDMWFASHCTCPLCRTAVKAVTSPDAAEELESGPAAATELAVSGVEPINREVRIEIPGPEPINREESESSSGGLMVKLPGYRRISSIRRLIFGDLRSVRVGNSDAERGESANGTPLPPPPPPPPPPSSQ